MDRIISQAGALEELGAMSYRVYENAKVELEALGLSPDKYEQACIALAEACRL